MTEGEWLASEDPAAMLRAVGVAIDVRSDPDRIIRARALSDRKLRLFAVAVASRARRTYPAYDPAEAQDAAAWCRNKHALITFAEKAALLREVAGNPFRPVDLLWREGKLYQQVSSRPVNELRGVVVVAREDRYQMVPWLTPDALSIARRAYDDRDWAALPVLADALEEAGCDSEDLLRHLRGQELEASLCTYGALPGPHVRGCWALDLILGKE